MENCGPTSTLEHLSDSVKSSSSPEKETASNTVIHHKVLILRIKGKDKTYRGDIGDTYGVSSTYRVLSRDLLIKRLERVRDCLENVLNLTPHQREVCIALLRYWAYYGKVYPKAAHIMEDTRCAKATYWRTVKILELQGLIEVVNRYLIRPHAQISNLYNLHKLIIVIARYLAEHGGLIFPKWIKPYILCPAREFWPYLRYSAFTDP